MYDKESDEPGDSGFLAHVDPVTLRPLYNTVAPSPGILLGGIGGSSTKAWFGGRTRGGGFISFVWQLDPNGFHIVDSFRPTIDAGQILGCGGNDDILMVAHGASGVNDRADFYDVTIPGRFRRFRSFQPRLSRITGVGGDSEVFYLTDNEKIYQYTTPSITEGGGLQLLNSRVILETGTIRGCGGNANIAFTCQADPGRITSYRGDNLVRIRSFETSKRAMAGIGGDPGQVVGE